jgi:hypothetical protein
VRVRKYQFLTRYRRGIVAQSKQSAKLFCCPNWDSPTPSPAGECAPPPPLVQGDGTQSLAVDRESWGGVPIPTRGQALWYSVTLGIYVQKLHVTVICGFTGL